MSGHILTFLKQPCKNQQQKSKKYVCFVQNEKKLLIDLSLEHLRPPPIGIYLAVIPPSLIISAPPFMNSVSDPVFHTFNMKMLETNCVIVSFTL